MVLAWHSHCFDTTDWEVLCSTLREDIDSLTSCITEYIHFFVESTVPTKRVQCFSNNKPWVILDLKVLSTEKKRVFRSGDKKDRKGERSGGLDSNRKRVEAHLQGDNATEFWRGLKTISGHSKNSGPENDDKAWANDLNLFSNEFDSTLAPSATRWSCERKITLSVVY